MRIQDRNTSGAPAGEAGRAQEAQRTERQESARPGSSPATGGGDRVELSSTLGQIAHAIQSESAQRGSRVEALAADYQNGRYRADPAATSHAMVSEAIGREMH